MACPRPFRRVSGAAPKRQHSRFASIVADVGRTCRAGRLAEAEQRASSRLRRRASSRPPALRAAQILDPPASLLRRPAAEVGTERAGQPRARPLAAPGRRRIRASRRRASLRRSRGRACRRCRGRRPSTGAARSAPRPCRRPGPPSTASPGRRSGARARRATASVAALRVLKNRAAQSHLSIRTASTAAL